MWAGAITAGIGDELTPTKPILKTWSKHNIVLNAYCLYRELNSCKCKIDVHTTLTTVPPCLHILFSEAVMTIHIPRILTNKVTILGSTIQWQTSICRDCTGPTSKAHRVYTVIKSRTWRKTGQLNHTKNQVYIAVLQRPTWVYKNIYPLETGNLHQCNWIFEHAICM